MINRFSLMLLAILLMTNLANGKELNGTYSGLAKSSNSGRTWPAILKIVSYNPNTGSLEGELHWTSLGAIHKVVGKLVGTRLTFKEVGYIKQGSAFLDCEYDATFSNSEISDTWTDLKSDKGTFQFSKQGGGGVSDVGEKVDVISNSVFTGLAKSSNSGRTWPASLKIVSYNPNTGILEGELHWTSLGAIHKIVGKLIGTRLTFKEVGYIKQGSAFLDCEYDATYSNNVISGSWTDLKSDKGTFSFNKE